jgi:hypothetical protein
MDPIVGLDVCRIRTPDLPAHNLVAIPATPSRLSEEQSYNIEHFRGGKLYPLYQTLPLLQALKLCGQASG